MQIKRMILTALSAVCKAQLHTFVPFQGPDKSCSCIPLAGKRIINFVHSRYCLLTLACGLPSGHVGSPAVCSVEEGQEAQRSRKYSTSIHVLTSPKVLQSSEISFLSIYYNSMLIHRGQTGHIKHDSAQYGCKHVPHLLRL